jgi:hypothetical protein
MISKRSLAAKGSARLCLSLLCRRFGRATFHRARLTMVDPIGDVAGPWACGEGGPFLDGGAGQAEEVAEDGGREFGGEV